MWHASAAPVEGGIKDKDYLRQRALAALENVGDSSAGQWEEWSGYAYHIRRRLTAEEQQQTGPAIDIRGTPEQDKRAQRVQKFLPPNMRGYKE